MIKPLKQVAGIDVAENELVVSLGRMKPNTIIEVFANKCFANINKGFSDLMSLVALVTEFFTVQAFHGPHIPQISPIK